MNKPVRQTAKLILHIGHFKTGTTALQSFCSANAELLGHQGLVYAPFGVKNHKHSALAFSVLRDAGVTKLLYDFASTRTAQDHWAEVFDAVRALPKDHSILVSSEEFMRLGEHPAAVALLRDIFATAPDIPIHIVAYLRAPNSHLRSWYNQLIKLGIPAGNFDMAVRSEIETIHWDYARALRPWLDIFGADRVTLRQFDDNLRLGDALYTDFLEAIGYRFPATASVPHKDPNPRLDDRVLDFKRAYTRAGIGPNIIAQAMTRAATNLDAEGDAEALRNAPSFETIRGIARAGITSLAKLPGASLNTAHLLANLPKPLPPEARMMGDLVALLAGELAQMRNQHRQMVARLTRLEKRLEAIHPTDDPA